MKITVQLIFFTIVCLFVDIVTANTWQDETYGLSDKEFYSMGSLYNTILVGTTDGLYKKVKDGWRQLFICRGQYRGVNDIYINENALYIATKNGLYKSPDFGSKWKRSFRDMAKENNCTRIIGDIYDKKNMYLGTEIGLFWSEDNGKSWKKFKDKIGDLKVKSIAVQNTNYLYVICNNELFKIDKKYKYSKKIFGTGIVEDLEEELDNENMPLGEEMLILNDIVCKEDKLYLSTNRGLFVSSDTEKRWRRFESAGLSNRFINYVLLNNDTILTATQNGVFQYIGSENVWKPLYRGMDSMNIKRLMLDKAADSVWALSENRVYKMYVDANNGSLNSDKIMSNFTNEPTIHEVQDMAIDYAEVHPDKIRKWRRDAKFKALFPKVSFGIDQGSSDTYEIYTSSSASYWVYGPDDRSEGWNLDFSWDLSDLVWNESQTSIDVRSKLMVQLRDDIIDEVTRLYFERRRLQIEMITDPPLTAKDELEKTLRLQELTAGIDGLTGGRFSRSIE